ncbi:phosphatase PAP2 family protein [Pseudogemmobacter bohemicus]|uniref:phosphatase PAP2 family protein n=1 Tax=Pseudogemmobacter bohemicus TaxID=2250708 RepID=UPI0018E5A2C5|nr:phosphatase PAP2 family protein [Pseudogemmobacter bohemicus]
MRRPVPAHSPDVTAGQGFFAPASGVDRMGTIVIRAILVVSFIFIAVPAIDLMVSRSVTENGVFVLAEDPLLQALRQVGLRGPALLVWSMVIVVGLLLVLPKKYAICAFHKPLFVLASFVVGPGIIVETLKPLFGRVRPRSLLEFGGTADFTPVWQFAGECARNCSFPSGEASGAAATLSVLVFVPPRHRWAAALFLTPLLAMIAFNRVLFGAHFLSDVMLGWLLTCLAMVWIWKWIDMRAHVVDRLLPRR